MIARFMPRHVAANRGNNHAPSGIGKPTREMPMPKSQNRLEQLSEEQRNEFLRRSSITYLECCIGLMLTHLTREETAEILEREADMLRQLD